MKKGNNRTYDYPLIILHEMFADTTDYIGPAIYRGGNLEMVRYAGYAFCANNPVNVVDPTGMEIRGVSKQDAKYLVEDFRAMFPGDEFENFRNLIIRSGKKQNGKSLAPISDDARKDALKDITLNEDQQALVDMVVNSINSEDMHEIEYAKGSGVLSKQAESSFLPCFMEGELAPYMSLILEKNDGIPYELIINEGGGGMTNPTARGSFTLIILEGEHPNGRPVTTGHEILGHGRSSEVGFDEKQQHSQAIRTENLILRVMGINFINTGERHGRERKPVKDPSSLPSFR